MSSRQFVTDYTRSVLEQVLDSYEILELDVTAGWSKDIEIVIRASRK